MKAVLRHYKGIYPTLGERTYIDSSAVVCGDIHFGDDCSVWPFVAIRGDVNIIRIGQRTNIQDGSVLHVTRISENNPAGYPLIIGDDVTIGHKVMLHGCQLGSRILVGMGAIIMDNVIRFMNRYLLLYTGVPRFFEQQREQKKVRKIGVLQ